jgi:elongator complex protein 1
VPVLLIAEIDTETDEVRRMLPHLFQFTMEHRREGQGLQDDVERFGRELGDAVREIWDDVQDAGGPSNAVARPEMGRGGEWRMKLYGH